MTPSDIQKSISEIRNAIANDDLPQAIKNLIRLTDTLKREEEYEEAITISANFNRLEKEIRQFLLDGNQISLRRNRLMDQMLDLLDDIEEPAESPPRERTNNNKEKQITYTSTGKGGTSSKWLYGVIAILALAFIAYMGFRDAKEDTTPANDKLCLTYLQDARNAFDRGAFKEALRHYTNAKNHCVDSKEASERIVECKRLASSSTNNSTNTIKRQSEGNTQAQPPAQKPQKVETAVEERPADPPPSTNPNQKIRPEFLEGLVASLQPAGFVNTLTGTDLQGMRGSARLNTKILKSRDRIPFLSNFYDVPVKEKNPIAIWYKGTQWRVYHPGLQTFKPQQKYNVVVLNKSSKDLIQHDATRNNTTGNETILSGSYPSNTPLFVMPIFTGESISRNAHPIAVYQKEGQWRIMNSDEQRMTPGARFYVYKAGKNAFVHKANASNSRRDGTLLDHPLTNGQATSILFVTQSWGGPEASNPSEIGLQYSESNQKWVIRNQNGTPIPKGAKFNVLVVNAN